MCKKCTIEGCERARSSKLYCQKHYRSFKLYGDPLKLKNNPVGDTCKHPGCGNTPRVRGLCDKHYTRLQRHGSTSVTVADPRDISLKQRIKRNIEKDDNGCWIWQKGLNSDGYGQISINAEKHRVHRMAYQEWVGEIPSGKEVCHKCDVRACCNPKHLFIATHKENVHDMIKKGRRASSSGERNGKSTLLEKEVFEVFDRVLWGETDEFISDVFGVEAHVIQKIRSGVTWSKTRENLPEYKKKALEKFRKIGNSSVKVFSAKDVLRVRRLIKKGYSVAYIARMFGVGETTVRNVRDGKTYSHV